MPKPTIQVFCIRLPSLINRRGSLLPDTGRHIMICMDIQIRQKQGWLLIPAYSDVRRAFINYLEYHIGSPIIIAGHSQGTQHAKTLIKEFFDGQLLKNRLVAAYLVGMPVKQDEFKTIPPCIDSLQTACFVRWRTFQKRYEGPAYLSREINTVVICSTLTYDRM